jgi:hypothetical protein
MIKAEGINKGENSIKTNDTFFNVLLIKSLKVESETHLSQATRLRALNVRIRHSQQNGT